MVTKAGAQLFGGKQWFFRFDVMETLGVLLLTSIIIRIVHYHWTRRRKYQMAAKIPGPTGWPIVGMAPFFLGSVNDLLKKVNYIMDRYPSPLKCWLGQELIIAVTDPRHIEIVFNHPECLGKAQIYDVTRPVSGDSIFIAAIPKWKKNRKLVSPAFNQRILNSYMPVFNEKAQELASALCDSLGQGQRDTLGLFTKCILDVALETTMGIKADNSPLSHELHRRLINVFKWFVKRALTFPLNVDILYYYTPIKLWGLSDLRWYSNYVKKVILEKQQNINTLKKCSAEIPEAEIKDTKIKIKPFLDLLLELSDNDRLSMEQIKDEVSIMLIAGVDTVATTLSFTTLMIAMHQDVQRKVYEEVIAVVGKDRPVDTDDLPSLMYLERVIKESMRLFPIAPVVLRSNSADIDLGDCVLPADSTILVFGFHTHRDPKYWPEPLKFDPDRFLPEEIAKRHPYTWVPFAGGPRICIGIKYAMMCMKTILANVVRKLSITTPYKCVEDIRLTQQFVLTAVDGAPLKVTLRV